MPPRTARLRAHGYKGVREVLNKFPLQIGASRRARQRQRVAVGIFRAAVFICGVIAVNFADVMQQGGNGRLFVCKAVIFVLVIMGVDDLRQLTVDGNAMGDQPTGEVVMKFC